MSLDNFVRFVCIACGIFGFYVPLRSSKTKWKIILFPMSILVNFAVQFLFLLFWFSKLSKPTSGLLGDYLLYLGQFFSQVMDIFIMCICLSFCRKFALLFQTFEEVDKVFASINMQFDFQSMKQKYSFVVLFLSWNILQQQFAVTWHLIQYYTFNWTVALYIYRQIHHWSLVLLLLTILTNILGRFHHLNKSLANLFYLWEENSNHKDQILQITPKPNEAIIRNVMTLHYKLCRSLKVIGRIFGIQVRFQRNLNKIKRTNWRNTFPNWTGYFKCYTSLHKALAIIVSKLRCPQWIRCNTQLYIWLCDSFLCFLIFYGYDCVLE